MRQLHRLAESLESRRLLAASYAPDPTWGDGGVNRTPFLSVGPTVAALWPTPAGGLLTIAPENGGSALQFFAFTADGSTDDTFPLDQRIVDTGVDNIQRLVKLDDGKVIGAGQGKDQASFALVRLNADYSVDTSFGN